MFTGFIFMKRTGNMVDGVVNIKAKLDQWEPEKREDNVVITPAAGGGSPRIDIIKRYSTIMIRGEVPPADFRLLESWIGNSSGIYFEDPDGEKKVVITKVTPNTNNLRVYRMVAVEMVVI